MSRRRRYPSLPCIPRWSAPGSHPRPTPPRRKNRPVAAATHSAALHSPPPSGSPRRRARIAGKSRPPWSGPVSAAPPAHPGMLRRCAATRCLPDTSLPSTRCRRCSTRDPTRDTADAASAHPPARRWPRSDPSAAPPDASPRCRPPPSPASACPSHSACYSPTTSAPTVPSNAALQADARFAACDSSCSCAYNRSPEMPPFPSGFCKFLFARDGDISGTSATFSLSILPQSRLFRD